MRILMQSRKTLFSVPGGDTVHIKEVAAKLSDLGVKVDISTELEPNLSKYDIVHIFNLVRPQEVYLQALNAKKQGKPVVLSPIYVSWEEYEKYGSTCVRRFIANILPYHSIEYLKIAARAVKNREFHRGTVEVLLKGYFGLMKKVVKLTDFFFPNSEMEMDRIKKDFNLQNTDYCVVPNAIDKSLFNYENTDIDYEIEKKIKDSVLCVAKISGNKNQLNLVKAMRGLPFKLFLIGYILPNHKRYFKLIKKEMGSNVEFLGSIPHEKLPQYYKAAKVHVLPSWFETTGLVSLEAAVMGCNIVITDKGYTRAYFKDFAFYCNPGNPDSIKDAILKAYNTPYNEDFRAFILNNYTRERAAEKILKGYETVLRLKNESK